MSRIGKRPIRLVSDVKVFFKDRVLEVKGPRGNLEFQTHPDIDLVIDEETLTVIQSNEKNTKTALIGTTWKHINNMIHGVSQGFQKKLILVGVGYRAALKGKQLSLQLGFSHDVVFDIPENVKITVDKQTTINISGFDKQEVGMVASKVQSFRPPEPYKGKGIREKGQYILRKEGKKK